MKISENDVFIRLLPVLIGVLTVYMLFLFAKKFFNEKIAIVASLLLAVSPYHVYYSQNLRSYSLLVLVALLSTHFFLEKKWKMYTVVNIVAFFTNYVYVFLILSHFFLVLLSKKRKDIVNFFLSQLPLLLLFILWLPQFLLQLQAGETLVMVLPEWKNLSSPGILIAIPITIFKLIAGQVAIQKNPIYIFYAGIIVLIVLWIFIKLKIRNDNKFNFLAILSFLPIFVAWLISFIIPLNNPPRLIFVLPFILLTFAHFIYATKDKHLIYIFLTICFFGIFLQNYESINRKEDWKGAVQYINSNTKESKSSSLAVFEFIAPFAPWLWYGGSSVEAVGAVLSKANEKDMDRILAPRLVGKNQIFLFEYFADVTDPNRLVRSYLEKKQFKSIGFQEFNNIGFVFEMRRPFFNQ